MASDARLVMSMLIQNGKGVLFEGLESLVGIGGGTGYEIEILMENLIEHMRKRSTYSM